MFGEPGTGDGQFNTPHGIAIDHHPGREPSVVVANRANNAFTGSLWKLRKLA